MTRPRPGRKDSGFALLLVFLMAAVIAITLYMEIPRVAFESQRQKEQLLVERGEQYKRAIQLFVKTNNRWPAKIEELESFNNRRFLRQRFKDPMTGKDEWRAVHIVNGILTDSVNNKQKPGDAKAVASTAGQYVGEQAGIGQALNNPQNSGVNLAMRKRASDNMPAGGMAGGGIFDPSTGSQPPNPGVDPVTGQPLAGAPVTGQPINGNPGQFPPGVLPPGVTGVSAGRPITGPNGAPATNNGGSSYVGSNAPYVGGGAYIGSQPSNPTTPQQGQYPGQQPGQQGQFGQYPGAPVNSQTGGVAPTYSTTPGGNGTPPNFNQPGTNVGAPNNAAADMIRQILTQPRPGGMPTNAQNGAVMGGGIAGFASTADADSIMLYNDHTNYGEWEFIFDPSKVKPLPNPNAGSAGVSASSLGSTPNGNMGTPVSSMPGASPAPGMPGGMNPAMGPTPQGGFGANPIRQ